MDTIIYVDGFNKGSNVNLAVWAMADAYEGRTQCVVIVSNDGDFVEPAKLLRARKTTVGVIIPRTGQRYNAIPANFKKPLHVADLLACQLPDPVISATGHQIVRPASWA